MIQFLKDQINRLEPYKHKALHEETIQTEMKQHHQELLHIVNESKEIFILDELDMDEEKDALLGEKFRVNAELREKQQQLQMAALEKNRMLKQCELNEMKLEKTREQANKLQSKSQSYASDKSKIIREIKQNEVINERICLENESLRKRCEQEIQKVSDRTVDKQNSAVETIIRKTLAENINLATKLISITEPLKEEREQLHKYNARQDCLKIVNLTHELEIQNSQNFLLRNELKCQEIKYFELSSKFQIVGKDHSIRQAISTSIVSQQSQLSLQINIERAKREELHSKLQQCKKLKRELEQIYGKLSTHYDTCKSSDFNGVKEMNKTSYRFERNITQQKHFLLERYSIVDNYRKYLSKNC